MRESINVMLPVCQGVHYTILFLGDSEKDSNKWFKRLTGKSWDEFLEGFLGEVKENKGNN